MLKILQMKFIGLMRISNSMNELNILTAFKKLRAGVIGSFALVFTLLISGCSSSDDDAKPMTVEESFMECRDLASMSHVEARGEGRFSYKNDAYKECMRPIQIRALFGGG